MAKIKYDFDPFEIAGISKKDVAKEDRADLLNEISDFVLTSVKEYMSNQVSPVKGHGKFKRLSKDYAEIKLKEFGNKLPNLEATGALKDALDVVPISHKLRLIVAQNEAGKAEGLNETNGTPRRFIPLEDEIFKDPIIKGIKRIVKDYTGD